MTNLAKTASPRYDYVRSLLQDRLPNGDVVEFGAAPGDQIVGLAKAGYTCTAVDIGIGSDGWADATEGRMKSMFDEHGISYVEWNLEENPYPLDSESADAVIMTEVYEHLRDYPIRSLEEAFRVLRPGGTLYFTTPNAAYLGSRFKLLVGKSPATPLPDWIGGLPHARHAREYTFAEIEFVLRRAGFHVDVTESRDFYRSQGRLIKRAAKRLLALAVRRRRTLGPSIVIVASK